MSYIFPLVLEMIRIIVTLLAVDVVVFVVDVVVVLCVVIEVNDADDGDMMGTLFGDAAVADLGVLFVRVCLCLLLFLFGGDCII